MDQQMNTTANIAEVWKCDDNTIDTNVTATSSVGMLKSAAQHHCAARADLEESFAHVAACEIHSRALTSFEKALSGDIAGNLQIIKQNVTQVCANQCISSCSYCASKLSGQESCFNGCATSCANSCYPGELKSYYAKLMQQNWPNNGACK
jgi:hypothetical protein